MEKSIKKNPFKFAITIIIVAGISIYYFNYFLSQRRQTELLNLQEKCANQSQKFFSNGDTYKDGDGIIYTYKNHFNSKLNKCFILIDSYSINNDLLFIDLYDVLENKHYASFSGHDICNKATLSITGQSIDKCLMDSGNIWLDGNDIKTPDFSIGYSSYNDTKNNVGDENTQKQFMEKIQPFMNN